MSGCTFLPARSSSTKEFQQIQDILQPQCTTPTLQHATSDCLVRPLAKLSRTRKISAFGLQLAPAVDRFTRITTTDKHDTTVTEHVRTAHDDECSWPEEFPQVVFDGVNDGQEGTYCRCLQGSTCGGKTRYRIIKVKRMCQNIAFAGRRGIKRHLCKAPRLTSSCFRCVKTIGSNWAPWHLQRERERERQTAFLEARDHSCFLPCARVNTIIYQVDCQKKASAHTHTHTSARTIVHRWVTSCSMCMCGLTFFCTYV